MDNQKSVEVTKPETTAQEYYADAKQTITLGVRNLIRAFPLPLFMIDSILQGILLEYRTWSLPLRWTITSRRRKNTTKQR